MASIKEQSVYIAEEKLLGGLMKRDCYVVEVIDKLNPDLFSMKEYSNIYKCIVDLYKEDITPDEVSVLNRASLYGFDIQPELVNRIYSKGHGVFTKKQLNEYCNIIISSSFKRKSIQLCSDFLENAKDMSTPEEIVDKFMNLSIDLSNKLRAENRTAKISVDTNSVLDNIDFMLENPDHIVGIPTGFPSLDKSFGGLKKGEIWTIGGESSSGKTYVILQMMFNIALWLLENKVDKYLAFISLEMTKEQLINRLIGICSGINPEYINKPHEYFISKMIPANEENIKEFKDKIREATNLINKLPIILDDSSELSADEIVAIAKKTQLKNGLACVFVDYVGLIGNNKETAWDDITATYRKFKYLAKSTDAPLVLLNQYNNADDKLNAKNKFRPDMYMLTGGKEPRNASHVILHILNYAIHQEFGFDNPEYQNKMYITNDKNRNGTQMKDCEIAFIGGAIEEHESAKYTESVAHIVYKDNFGDD